jgi:hypothetical protein
LPGLQRPKKKTPKGGILVTITPENTPGTCQDVALCYNLHYKDVLWEEEYHLTELLPGTIIPWLIGVLLLLVLLAITITVKSWRESKRSPYFFLRQQAAKRMQKYMVATISLVLATVATSAYAWQSPVDSTPRVSVLSHAKPLAEGVTASISLEADDLFDVGGPEALDLPLLPASERLNTSPNLVDPLLQPSAPTLPEQFDRFDPTAEVTEETQLGEMSFSTDITQDYQPLEAGRRFVEGFFTLYATFSYEGMADGMVWAWVWRHNGEVVDGGNQIWAYGSSGPGYVYFQPETGFQLGEYSLEIWLNRELVTQANVMITDGVAASN